MSLRANNKLFWGRGALERVLSVILALAILGALGMLVYVIGIPKGESFTEFYLLGLSGEARGYPGLLVLGEEAKVKVGIVNRERKAMNYRVEVKIDGIENTQVGAVTLEPNEQWEDVVGFTPNKIGDRQKVEFLLYQSGQSEAYQRLHLWVDVQGNPVD